MKLLWKLILSGHPKDSEHWATYIDLLKGVEEDALYYFETALLGSEFSAADAEVPPVIHEYHYVQWYGNPWSGGSHDQPAIFMELLNICSSKKMEVQKMADRNREIREKANGNSGMAKTI